MGEHAHGAGGEEIIRDGCVNDAKSCTAHLCSDCSQTRTWVCSRPDHIHRQWWCFWLHNLSELGDEEKVVFQCVYTYYFFRDCLLIFYLASYLEYIMRKTQSHVIYVEEVHMYLSMPGERVAQAMAVEALFHASTRTLSARSLVS